MITIFNKMNLNCKLIGQPELRATILNVIETWPTKSVAESRLSSAHTDCVCVGVYQPRPCEVTSFASNYIYVSFNKVNYDAT